jgi:hypothetical protein
VAGRPLSIDALLAAAKVELARDDGAKLLAQGVIDLLAEDQLCGMPEPEAYPGEVYITREMTGRWDPTQAQSLGVALLRAAEKGREGV